MLGKHVNQKHTIITHILKGKKEMQFELTNFFEIDKFSIQSYCLMHDVDQNLNLGDISKVNTADMEYFNLLVGGSPCFVAGTKVLTSIGYKNIENMKVGDKVLTHKNRYMPVERVGGERDKEIYSFQVAGFLPVECTDYHPFYCKATKVATPEKLHLSEIKPGYYIGSHIINNEMIAYFLQTASIDELCNLSAYQEKSMKMIFVKEKEQALRLALMIEKIYRIGCNVKYNSIVKAYEITYNDDMEWFIEDNIIWYPVKAIKNTRRKENVYNIEVAEDHTYTANNMITYNCQ